MINRWLASLAVIIFENLLGDLIEWVKKLLAARKQQEVDQENVKHEQEAIDHGSEDEIARAGESVLNGELPKS